MPLQPSSQGLITPAEEVVHILGQLQALPEVSGNPSTLTWSLVSYIEGHKKRSDSEPKNCLHPIVGREEEDTTSDPTCAVGYVLPAGSQMTTASGVEAGGILGEVSLGLLGGWSVVRGLFRAQLAGGLILALGLLLLHRAIIEQEPINGHVSLDHHLVLYAFGFGSRRIYRLDLYLVGKLDFNTGFLNRGVDSTTLKN